MAIIPQEGQEVYSFSIESRGILPREKTKAPSYWPLWEGTMPQPEGNKSIEKVKYTGLSGRGMLHCYYRG